MEENVIQDALRLAKNILKSLLPNKKRDIVNIAFHDKDTFYLEEYASIPQSFGYKLDNTIIFLEQNGVIEGKTIGWWYVGIMKMSSYLRRNLPDDLSMDDNISEIAREKGFIDKDEAIQYYYNVSKKDDRPKIDRQAAVLINKKALEEFCKKFTNNIQIPEGMGYLYNNGQLFFRLVDGSIDSFNFSGAKISRKVFETFFNLWRKDGVGTYKKNEIIKEYKKFFNNEDISANRIGEIVSNIRPSIIKPKVLISDRIEWRFDRKNDQWIFKISPMSH